MHSFEQVGECVVAGRERERMIFANASILLPYEIKGDGSRWRSLGDSNPCFLGERANSAAHFAHVFGPSFEGCLAFGQELMALIDRCDARDRSRGVVQDLVSDMRRNPEPCHA